MKKTETWQEERQAETPIAKIRPKAGSIMTISILNSYKVKNELQVRNYKYDAGRKAWEKPLFANKIEGELAALEKLGVKRG